jgi:hypothetical protein
MEKTGSNAGDAKERKIFNKKAISVKNGDGFF